MADSPSKIVSDMKKGKLDVQEIEPGIYRATSDTSEYIIEYDKNKCIGAASCSVIAPLTFFMNDENKADFVIDPQVPEGEPTLDTDDAIMEGAQSCPVLAIKIIEKSTGDILFPIE
ncbi:MAG: ferredoxin [Candidatus Dojkabacteria bacterium]